MREKLRNIIAGEDPKRPLTDTRLCKSLQVSREYITQLRKELRIADSRERKRAYICKEIQAVFAEFPTVSGQRLLSILESRGFLLSRYLLDKYLTDMNLRQARGDALFAGDCAAAAGTGEGAFERLVGADGSLEMQIQQAKATMLYPPNGLHCLILGETGVGKSELAEAMHGFAVEAGTLLADAPFIVFNCADYADNAQLLISQLFGCVKGAYTGAAEDKKGLIERADGGILFLDEVHRLSSEGQEMLFQLIDKGAFRRLGETDAARRAKVQLIAATTENIETHLLATFKRRIPMLITVPALMERPLGERLELIQKFFGDEAARMNAKLQVGADAVKAYLLYECKGNIGQLKSDIQVACAKSFLSYVTNREHVVKVGVHRLAPHVKKGLMKLGGRRGEIDSLVWTDSHFDPAQCARLGGGDEDLYSFPREFYSYIETAYAKYMEKGVDVEQIRRRLGEEIENKLHTVIAHVKRRLTPLSAEEVSKVVGADVIALIRRLLEVVKRDLGEIDASIAYCLAIHLNAMFARCAQGKAVINPNLGEIRRKFPKEYAAAAKMTAKIEELKGLSLPEDEIGYIALYLRGNEKEEEAKVGVVVATHGGAGGCMLEIACKLLNVSHGAAFSMSFEENPRDALERLTEVVADADEGKGVLLLADMGSLLSFGEIIRERMNIAVETVERVDTVMVIEALRRSILPGCALRDMLYGIASLNYTFPKTPLKARETARPRAIITLCLTGEGAALYCRRQLKKNAGSLIKGIEILDMGMIGEQDIYRRFQKAAEKYDILGIVGSVDPKIPAVPYLPMDWLPDGRGAERLREIIAARPGSRQFAEASDCPPGISGRMRFVAFDERGLTKETLLKKMCGILYASGNVKAGYEAAVFEREKMGNYLIRQRVALPHADSRYILRPAILLARTAESILWDGANATRLVCLLALGIEGKDDIRYLYRKFQDDRTVDGLEKAATAQELREALFYGGHCGRDGADSARP